MPEPIENPIPVAARSKSSERTEAKFFEDAEKVIAEAEREGAEYDPPNPNAELDQLKSKQTAVLAARAADQTNEAAEEQTRNTRENLFKPLSKDITALVNYAKSAGKADNEIAALQAIARDIKGARARAIDPADGNPHISVSNMSYASRADNYAEFIEGYAALAIDTKENFYKPDTHRAKVAAQREATNAVIAAEAASNTTREQLDKLAYTDPDSLLNGCVSAKTYIKSKYGTTGQPYKNIAKTRFEIPKRLRKK